MAIRITDNGLSSKLGREVEFSGFSGRLDKDNNGFFVMNSDEKIYLEFGEDIVIPNSKGHSSRFTYRPYALPEKV
jgi:hypothetical protein